MAKDCYPRFLRSPAYRDLLRQAKPTAKPDKHHRPEKNAWAASAGQEMIVKQLPLKVLRSQKMGKLHREA